MYQDPLQDSNILNKMVHYTFPHKNIRWLKFLPIWKLDVSTFACRLQPGLQVTACMERGSARNAYFDFRYETGELVEGEFNLWSRRDTRAKISIVRNTRIPFYHTAQQRAQQNRAPYVSRDSKCLQHHITRISFGKCCLQIFNANTKFYTQ